MRALFATAIAAANPVLPPHQPIGDETHLHYAGPAGETRGGFWLVGHVPQAPTCLVVVDSSEDTVQAMHEDPAYLWIEDLAQPEGDRASTPPRERSPTAIAAWLAAMGHTGVNLPPQASDRAVAVTMLRVHGVSWHEYQRAGGALLD